MNIFSWRNRDADVQLDMRFRHNSDDPADWTIWVETSDGQCNNARYDDADQLKEPSRHVELVVFMFGFRFELTVCVILRAARDTALDARRYNQYFHM